MCSAHRQICFEKPTCLNNRFCTFTARSHQDICVVCVRRGTRPISNIYYEAQMCHVSDIWRTTSRTPAAHTDPVPSLLSLEMDC